jgi:hypothetical protein
MHNFDQCESMLRLNNYLEAGTYKPFGPSHPSDSSKNFVEKIECMDTSDRTKIWEPTKESSLDALSLPESTLQLFLCELDLYLFAVEIEYDKLRRTSITNIIRRYPKNVKAILALVEKIFPVADRLKDDQLTTYILRLVVNNSKSLAKSSTFTTLMKANISAKNRLGKAMLDGFIMTTESWRQKLSELAKKEAALATWKEPSTAPPPSVELVKKVDSFSPPRSPSLSGGPHWEGLRPEDLYRLYESIRTNSLVVALEAGYGTLCKRGAMGVRNRDFTFDAGELLLVSHKESSSNKFNNLIVYNSRGDRGDILHTLVREVPSDIGVIVKSKWLVILFVVVCRDLGLFV